MDSDSHPSDEQAAQSLRQNAELKDALSENAELKEAVREMESRVADANAAAEEVEHLVYAISHDFRTPLRTIASYAQLLERQYSSDQETREMTAFIVKGVNDMKVLIEDVLKYSRIRQSPPRMMVALRSVVQWAALNLDKAIQDTGARVNCGDLPEVAINESQFVQLFEQLFANSLKFRSAHAPLIQVTAEEGPQAYLISVRDNGVGIDPKYHDAVFAPFKRLYGKEVPGTGLGLAICRKIVRAHGGKIWVESDGGEGALFRFTIPF